MLRARGVPAVAIMFRGTWGAVEFGSQRAFLWGPRSGNKVFRGALGYEVGYIFLVPPKGHPVYTLTNFKKEPYIHSPRTASSPIPPGHQRPGPDGNDCCRSFSAHEAAGGSGEFWSASIESLRRGLLRRGM